MDGWHSGAGIAHHVHGAARLVPAPPEGPAGQGLAFAFAREPAPQDPLRVLHPPTPVFPATIECEEPPPAVPELPLLAGTNRFLRTRYPHVDVPKDVLFETLLADRNHIREAEDPVGSRITASYLPPGRELAAVASAGGPEANELYVSVLDCHRGGCPPTFHANKRPVLAMPTPILDLSSHSAPPYVLIAIRTWDSTTFLRVAWSGATPAAPLEALRYEVVARLSTRDSNCTAHIAASAEGGLIMDARGDFWGFSVATGKTLWSRIGKLPLEQPETEDADGSDYRTDEGNGRRRAEAQWARLVVTPAGLVAATRHAVFLLGTLQAGNTKLYSTPDGALVTALSLLSRSRLVVCTTSALIFVSIPSPRQPALVVSHGRSTDRTLDLTLAQPQDTDAAPVGVLWSKRNGWSTEYRFSPDSAALRGYPRFIDGAERAGLVALQTQQGLVLLDLALNGAVVCRVMGEGTDGPNSLGDPGGAESTLRVWPEEVEAWDRESRRVRLGRPPEMREYKGLDFHHFVNDFEAYLDHEPQRVQNVDPQVKGFQHNAKDHAVAITLSEIAGLSLGGCAFQPTSQSPLLAVGVRRLEGELASDPVNVAKALVGNKPDCSTALDLRPTVERLAPWLTCTSPATISSSLQGLRFSADAPVTAAVAGADPEPNSIPASIADNLGLDLFLATQVVARPIPPRPSSSLPRPRVVDLLMTEWDAREPVGDWTWKDHSARTEAAMDLEEAGPPPRAPSKLGPPMVSSSQPSFQREPWGPPRAASASQPVSGSSKPGETSKEPPADGDSQSQGRGEVEIPEDADWAYSQVLPGPHANRKPIKKRRRIGGF